MKPGAPAISLISLALLFLAACGSGTPTAMPVDLKESPPTFFYFYTGT